MYPFYRFDRTPQINSKDFRSTLFMPFSVARVLVVRSFNGGSFLIYVVGNALYVI